MQFIFLCLNRYLTLSLRSLVRYRFKHSKINSISARPCIIHCITNSTAIDRYSYLETLTLLYFPHISTVWNSLFQTVEYSYLETLILLYIPHISTVMNRYSYLEALIVFNIPHISISHHDSTNKPVSHNACNDEDKMYCCYGNISWHRHN